MKFLAVCGFGVGSSMILKMSVEKALRALGVEADVENTDIASVRGTPCDAIFTSTELANELRNSVKVPVLPVKRYMDVKEVTEQLQSFLNEREENKK